MKKKTLKVYAYTLDNQRSTQERENPLEYLLESLRVRETLQDRLMPLSAGDSAEEFDLLTFHSRLGSFVCCVILPLVSTGATAEFPQSMLSQAIVTSDDLQRASDGAEARFTTLPPCYFAASKSHIVVCTLPKYSLKRFETYFNWLTQEKRGDYWLKFNPVVSSLSEQDFQSAQAIILDDLTKISVGETSSLSYFTKAIRLAGNQIFDAIQGLDGVTDLGLPLEDIFDLQLTFKIKKSKIQKEARSEQLSKLVRLFVDEENAILQTKNRKVKINTEIRISKQIELEYTEKGAINEAVLFGSLSEFLSDLAK